MNAFNPALLEILSRKVSGIADEMALTLKRTARSAFVKEGGDMRMFHHHSGPCANPPSPRSV